MDSTDRQLFIYTFIPNIDQYEPKLFLGLTLYEAFGVAAAFVGPVMMFQNGLGMVFGIVGGIAAFALLKRFESFGNLSFPIYLFKRGVNKFNNKMITLAHLHPQIVSEVKVKDFDGHHLATYGKKK